MNSCLNARNLATTHLESKQHIIKPHIVRHEACDQIVQALYKLFGMGKNLGTRLLPTMHKWRVSTISTKTNSNPPSD